MKRTGVSVKYTLEEIGDFVKWHKRQDGFAGCNVCVSRWPGKSYVIAKYDDSLQPRGVLPIFMDYSNPIERPLIANAINEAMYGIEMTPEAMENEMVCKVETWEEENEHKNKMHS